MKTRQDVLDIVNRIVYKDWKFRLQNREDGWLIQATFIAPDIHSGEQELQLCRKFYVSPHACYSEVIRTAYLATKKYNFSMKDEVGRKIEYYLDLLATPVFKS